MSNQYLMTQVPNGYFNLTVVFKSADMDNIMQCDFFKDRELASDSIFDYDHSQVGASIAKYIELNSAEVTEVVKNLLDAQIEADIMLSEPDCGYSDIDYSDIDFDVVVRHNAETGSFYATTYDRKDETIAYELNLVREDLIKHGYAEAANHIAPRITQLHPYGWVSMGPVAEQVDVDHSALLMDLLKNNINQVHETAKLTVLSQHTYETETKSQGSIFADILVQIQHPTALIEFSLPAYVYFKRVEEGIEVDFDLTDHGSLEASYGLLYKNRNFDEVPQDELETLDKMVDQNFKIREVSDWSKQLLDSIEWRNWDLVYLLDGLKAYSSN